ncbi:MAG: type II toxin-antitoxin system VapC family toxin [Polaromonas sp.]
MKYMLDSNICIYALNATHRSVLEKFREHGPQSLGISAVVAAELAFGAENSNRPANRDALNEFLQTVTVLAWEPSAIWHYARIRKQLKEVGILISAMDLLIASHALELNLTLVTNNTREFERVDGLKLENWA